MGTPRRRRIAAAATALLWTWIALLTREVHSFGIFELKLVSFAEDVWDGPATGCPRNCSVFLRFCVNHYQATVDVLSPSCTFHEFITPLLQPDQPLDTMTFEPSFAWPGQFSMVVEAWHPPDRGLGKELVSRFTVQKALEVGPDWTVDNLNNTKTALTIKYRVVCSENYYGAKCETLCRPRDDSFGHNICTTDGQKVCRSGWQGNYCQDPVCAGCLNGNCEAPGNCTCRPGWSGSLCDQCIPYPGCDHGRCIFKPWQCICEEGWGGHVCDQDLNYCTNHKPCQKGGTCTNTGQGSYTCSCATGFMGTNCEIPENPCSMQPCHHGGNCLNTSPGNYTCECLSGFFGRHCETSANICFENLCENGATCIADPAGYICSCALGYTGTHCEELNTTDCKVHRCLNGGSCLESSKGSHCQCPVGIKGPRCETRVHCSSSACENGGTCTETSNGIVCTCPVGFSGTQCQIKHNQCSSNPCANDAQCTNLVNGYSCDCKPGYSGKNCDLHNPCISTPCQNGGTCHTTEKGFDCSCPSRFRGAQCQLAEGASNVSHRISEEEPLSSQEVVLVASLSCVLVLLVILICLVVRCFIRRRREQNVEAHPQGKMCDFDTVEEQLQNERNMQHMNNKQYESPQKIVNELDRALAKMTNDVTLPPKVLNNQANRNSRTIQKIDNMSGSSTSCHSQSGVKPTSGVIYIIEDHLQLCPDTGQQSKTEHVLATEV